MGNSTPTPRQRRAIGLAILLSGGRSVNTRIGPRGAGSRKKKAPKPVKGGGYK